MIRLAVTSILLLWATFLCADEFTSESKGHVLILEIQNPYEQTIANAQIEVLETSPFVEITGIDPARIPELGANEAQDVRIAFDIGKVEEDSTKGRIQVLLKADEGLFEDPTPEVTFPVKGARNAACNSAIGAGNDAPETISVDLGDFIGKAGFSWEMYDIKDQMDVTVAGVTKTTGCVSGSGTIEFDIAASGSTASVSVLPNCEGTSGTAWNFTLECPLASDVTNDADGNPIDADTGDAGPPPAGGLVGQLNPQTPIPTAVGQPIAPAPLPPSVIGPPAGQGGETEPNNDYSTATPISLGDTITGSIGAQGDRDHYAVSLPHQGELTIAFPHVPPEVNIAFRVLDSNGYQVWGWQGAPNNGGTFSGWVDLSLAGTYIIDVSDGSSNAISATPYTMTTQFSPTADIGEPNDSYQNATPLDWNQAIRANILPRGDADHYRISASRMGQLTVAFPTAPPSVDIAFRVLDANGYQVWGWQGAANNGESYVGTADLIAPGDYIIDVRDGSSNARSAVPYEMVASLDPAFDAAEPNNGVSSATPLPFETQVWANILPRGDSDLYKVQITQQGELTVDFSASPDTLDLAFRVLDANGYQVWGWQGAAKNGELYQGWADLKSPGTYIIDVRDGSSNARSALPYSFTARFVETLDPAEPNDAFNTATALALNQSVSASILPRGDADHYAIDVPARGQLSIDLPVSIPNLNLAFRVLDQNGYQVWSWQGAANTGDSYKGLADLPGAGRYIVDVRDGSSNARSALPYQIIATFDPVADNANEPNETAAQATPMTLRETVIGSIHPQGDADFYVFSTQTGEIDVAFTKSPENLNMAFRLLDMAGYQMVGWQGASASGELFSATAKLPSAGQYIIDIRDGSSNARSTEAYSFVVTDR